jgi:tetratricopeptide (TPR) repeat protein
VDLVGELQRDKRRRKIRRVILLLVLLVVIAILCVVAKLLWDQRTLERSLDEARELFAQDLAASSLEAARVLRRNVDLDDDHGPTLAALALVRARSAMASLDEAEISDAREDLELARAGSQVAEVEVAAGMLALLGGDHAAAIAACDAADGLQDSGFAPRHAAWLRARVTLASGQVSGLADAAAALDSAVQASPDWPAYHRAAISIDFRAGRVDQAIERIAKARKSFEAHLGLAVDEALYLAVLGRNLAGVAASADALLQSDLAPRDRGRALAARGVSAFGMGEVELGLKQLEEARAAVPAWDRDSTDLALEALLSAGQVGAARAWLGDHPTVDPWPQIYEAWALLAEGKVIDALERLSALPQDNSRVAYLQALALVEQRRHAEAGPWLDIAGRSIPGRVDLAVASARAQAYTGDAKAAVAALDQIATDHPYAPRVWTGLGEALLEGDADKEASRKARQALERALEREVVAAEARLLLAELELRVVREDPAAWGRALELHERGAEINPNLPRYRGALGVLLSDMGHPRRAEEMLRSVADEPGVDPDTLLALARVSAKQAALSGKRTRKKARKQIKDWLAAAKAAGAAADQVERARLLTAVALAKADELPQLNAEVERLAATAPKSVELQVLRADVLRRMGAFEDAKQVLRQTLRRVPRRYRGRIHLALARIEAQRGKRRPAAGLGWKGLTAMANEPRPPSELLEAAQFVVRQWQAIRQKGGARGVGRKLTQWVPFHPQAWLTRGKIQLDGGYLEYACASAEKAIGLDPDIAEAHALLGACLRESGDKERAKEAYTTAAKLARGTDLAKEYKKILRKL